MQDPMEHVFETTTVFESFSFCSDFFINLSDRPFCNGKNGVG